eukprot:jgi/Botrbrau1/14587/Bobra.0312s0010.1
MMRPDVVSPGRESHCAVHVWNGIVVLTMQYCVTVIRRRLPALNMVYKNLVNVFNWAVWTARQASIASDVIVLFGFPKHVSPVRKAQLASTSGSSTANLITYTHPT